MISRDGAWTSEEEHLEGLAQVVSCAKVDGGHVSEARFCEETVGVGQRDGLLSELHCVQPVSYVLDLGRGEEEAGLKVLEGAHVELDALEIGRAHV